VLRLPVFLFFITLTWAPLARADDPPAPSVPAAAPEPAPSAVPANDKPEPAVPAADVSPVPRDEANRLAEPDIQIPKSEPPELAAEEFSLGWTLVRTMVVLAMVVALAYLTLNVGLRRLLGIRAPVGTSVVTVLERVSLDQKRSLFVVEAAGEVLLIGGADSALTLITKLDRAQIDKLRTTPPASPLQLSPFLKKLLGRKDEAPPPPPAPPAPNLDGNP
jgi:flagellar protein FliO/FliZ